LSNLGWSLLPQIPAPDSQRNESAGAQHGPDRAPLVHRSVAFGDLPARQFEIEDFAGIDESRSTPARSAEAGSGEPAPSTVQMNSV
jgi:hypothetical protein